MPILGIEPFNQHESPAERRRRGLLYAATFCALLFAIDLGMLNRSAGGSASIFDFLPFVAMLTGAMALLILHNPPSMKDRILMLENKREPRPRAAFERLATFKQWRRTRTSTFEQFGLQFPDIESPVIAATSPVKSPRKGGRKNPEQAIDPWARALEDFDTRNADRRS